MAFTQRYNNQYIWGVFQWTQAVILNTAGSMIRAVSHYSLI